MFKATGIILAGGQSRRMNGRDKAQLVIETRALIEHKVERLREWFAEVLIVCRRGQQYDYPGTKIVFDEQKGHGPLMGLYSGLKAGSYERSLVTACDMPFDNYQLARLLMKAAPESDIVVPVVNGYREPMLAVYHKNVLPAIKQSLAAGQRKMVSFYERLNVREIAEEEIKTADPELLSFLNVNTPVDFARAKEIAGRRARKHA